MPLALRSMAGSMQVLSRFQGLRSVCCAPRPLWVAVRQPRRVSFPCCATSCRRMPEVRQPIVPTHLEERIFKTLQEAAHKCDKPVTLRCAGGWVRDKLLGLDTDSPDIDIALDTLTGSQFGEALEKHLAESCDELSRSVVIQSNPEQSKHLETATIKVHGVSLDLVNLRSETYSQDSRIPGSIEFGTPEEDALRRDLTINALFYNLEKREVEDFTGKGIDDLRTGIIRTPLQPRETFMDDPLRVLRAIRFAARFGFELDTELTAAAALPEVREALATKVSRERFGSELSGCMKGPDPVHAMHLVQRLCIFPTVFQPPAAMAAALGDSFGGPCCDTMAAAFQLLNAWQPQEPLPDDQRRLTLLSALLLPLRDAEVKPKGNSKKEKHTSGPVARTIVRDALKWPAKGSPDKVVALHEAAPRFAAIRADLQAAGVEAAPAELRARLGLEIRKLKELWRCGVALAPLLSLPSATPLGVESVSATSSAASQGGGASQPGSSPTATRDGGGGASGADGTSDSRAADRASFAADLEAAAVAFKVDRAWEIKALLNGKEVQAAAGIKPGPGLGKLTAALLEWQLGHLDVTVDDARCWLSDNQQRILADDS